MLKLYTWKTPNGYKIPILLEELGVPYLIYPIDISKGEQKTPEFLAMNPNHKIPVLIDDAAPDGSSITIFESGAILLYLANKHQKFLSKHMHPRMAEIEWLMFQMASIGPMFGQANHFIKYAPEKVPYAEKRYVDESQRLLGVMETRLAQAPYLGGDEYSIADIATWPWIRTGITNGFGKLDAFPNVQHWYDGIEARLATQKALKKIDTAIESAEVCVPSDK